MHRRLQSLVWKTVRRLNLFSGARRFGIENYLCDIFLSLCNKSIVGVEEKLLFRQLVSYCGIALGLSVTIHFITATLLGITHLFAMLSSKQNNLQTNISKTRLMFPQKLPDHDEKCLLIRKRDDRSVCGSIDVYSIKV